ncbi:MAG TPA: hypothetical protein VNZ64_12365 [Candidatus Acidoferrum sp.]|jgi:hypothetical protein|nr:hypothetical protein [Candidatus Acidoferrum sp.]
MKIVNNFDARKTASAQKRILFAIAFLCVLGAVLWPSLRAFAIKHPGIIGVLVAVTGEVYFDWKEEIGKHARWKKFFMALLVVSLTYELYEASETDKEAADAIILAGKANERAAKNEAAAKELEIEVAKQRERAAQAEFRIMRLQKWGWPRWELFRAEAFQDSLTNAPKGRASIWFIPSMDHEPEGLGRRIAQSLKTAGWTVTEPQPIPESARARDLWRNLSEGVTIIGRSGGTLKGSPGSDFVDPLISALSKAFVISLSGVGYVSDAEMKGGEIRIAIGRNPWKSDTN